MKDVYTYYTNNDGFSLLAFEPVDVFDSSADNCLEELAVFLKQYAGDYRFGFLSYDVKTHLLFREKNPQKRMRFPKIGFFIPQFVVEIDGANNWKYLKGEPSEYSEQFIRVFLAKEAEKPRNNIVLSGRLTQEEYQNTVAELQNKMQDIGVEVVVFCQEFYAENRKLDAVPTFFSLNALTKAPFACFLQWEDQYLLSASPERFLKKEGNKIMTQPIKGTARRGSTLEEDERLKQELTSSLKEQEENSSVVKGIEHELLALAHTDSVRVEEFSKVYTFETVHQLISTIVAEVPTSVGFTELVQEMFPMGSMVGAPKFFARELLAVFEEFDRGLYSGTVGYIKPNGDFDFNVVIRSILYNEATGTLVCPVGGGITLKSDPEKEYYECLIKLKALQSVLNDGE